LFVFLYRNEHRKNRRTRALIYLYYVYKDYVSNNVVRKLQIDLLFSRNISTNQ